MLRIIRSAVSQDTMACRLLAGSSPLHCTFNRLDVGPWPDQGMLQRNEVDDIWMAWPQNVSGPSAHQLLELLASDTSSRLGTAVRGSSPVGPREGSCTRAKSTRRAVTHSFIVRDSRCWAQADRQASPSDRPWDTFLACTHTVSLRYCTYLAPNVLHNGDASCAPIPLRRWICAQCCAVA